MGEPPQLTCRKEKSLLCSIMVISRLPMTISQPVYSFLVRLYWTSEFPMVLRMFWVPLQTTTAADKNALQLISAFSTSND